MTDEELMVKVLPIVLLDSYMSPVGAAWNQREADWAVLQQDYVPRSQFNKVVGLLQIGVDKAYGMADTEEFEGHSWGSWCEWVEIALAQLGIKEVANGH